MPAASTFAYTATTAAGEKLTGTIDADGLDAARRQLDSLKLAIDHITPHRVRSRPLSGSDFAAFNQQLAQLTRAGLPLEQGLRLIAEDLRTGRLAEATRQIADDLEHGQSLAEAFDRRRNQFPPLYGRLVDAGVKANDLPGMLFNLGRHMELVRRLRESLWRSLAYPLTVMIALLAVLTFLGMSVLPKMEDLYRDFHVQLPDITRVLIAVAAVMPAFLIALGVAIVVLILLQLPPLRRIAGPWGAALALRLPLIGPVLRRNLIARWCDALNVAVSAGLDLPAAIDLANQAVHSPPLSADGRQMQAALAAGKPLDQIGPTILLPATVPATLHLGATHGSLPEALQTLSRLYEQQAEVRMAALPAILIPALTILAAALIGFVIAGLFVPFVVLIRSIGF